MPGFYLPSEDEFDPTLEDFVPPFLSKERDYKHFDLPLADGKRECAINFAQESDSHRFLPLLGFTETTRRYVRTKDKNGNWLTGENGEYRKQIVEKSRDIRFAGHDDSAYLQAYAAHLNVLYERALVDDGTDGSVLAYRKGGGTNIHHAKSLFDEISSRVNCSVFAMDISGFFDCLDHMLLRDEVAGLTNSVRLTGHHGSVWQNLTRYSWVETDDLDHLLGLRRERHGRVCTPHDFVKHVRGRKSGLVRTHDLDCGIPQGTPVSGLYANIYLRAFDRQMIRWCKQHDGSYRRYSDDIAIVLPLGTKCRHVVAVVEKMLADVCLAMSVDKTETADFEDGLLTSAEPIQYLGFTFDGRETLIRESSIDAYRSKMRRGIHAKFVAAKRKKVPPEDVFQRELRSRYTHAGKRRNFLKYAQKAADVMGSPEIRRQVRRHQTWFNRAWGDEMAKVYGSAASG